VLLEPEKSTVTNRNEYCYKATTRYDFVTTTKKIVKKHEATITTRNKYLNKQKHIKPNCNNQKEVL
jgi:hypothetical protein